MYFIYVLFTIYIFIVTLCGGGIDRELDENELRWRKRELYNNASRELASNHTAQILFNDSTTNETEERVQCRSEPSILKRVESSEIIFVGEVKWLGGKVRDDQRFFQNINAFHAPGGRVGGVTVKKYLKGGFSDDYKELVVEGFESKVLCSPKVRIKNQRIFFASKITGKHVGLTYPPIKLSRRSVRHIRHILEPKLQDPIKT